MLGMRAGTTLHTFQLSCTCCRCEVWRLARGRALRREGIIEEKTIGQGRRLRHPQGAVFGSAMCLAFRKAAAASQ